MMADDENQVIPVDSDPDASELESLGSDLTSLSSSIFNYTYENGRTYHAYRSGNYVLPNDEPEQDRLNLLHHIFRLSLNGELCRTKLVSPQKILDVGTGTGIWAIEMGDEYPSAEIIGTDLSPIQPGWVPPNVRFEIDDASQEWDYPVDSFDFIHVRGLAGAIRDWPKFLEQAYKHLKPGGSIELAECRTHMDCDDGTYPEDCYTYKWIAEFNRVSQSNGMIFDMFPHFAGLLRDSSFTNVEVLEEPCPIGVWPKDKKLKEIGRCFRAQFLDGAVDSYSMALFTRFGGWIAEEVQVLLAHVREEIKTNKMHVYTHCSFATAQKPLR